MSSFSKRAGAALALTLALTMSGCSTASDGTTSAKGTPAGGADTFSIYATTGYIADAVANIAPNATITTMVGPGGDPHTYQPSTKDIEAMTDADAVLWNGLYLEAQMVHQLESFGDKQLAVGEEVDPSLLLDWPETDSEGNPLSDPHVWNSPEAWQQVVTAIANKLGELDSDNAQSYKDNAVAYNKEIAAAHDKISTLMADDVAEPRILITGHDAFNYFGDTYDLEVRATDFVSTEAALSATELSELADYIVDNKVPVIFQDNQANPQAITSLKEAVESRGWSVTISSEELFADSLGATAPVDTYLGVLEHNATAVADAL